MSNERPDALLKSALEKIVYFEARGESLSNDLASARAESEHLKSELSRASQREIEARREVAELEVKLHRVASERDELARIGQALRQERSTLIGHVLEAASIHESGRSQTERLEDGPFDLASFIAELRSEVLALQRGEVAKGSRPLVSAPKVELAAAPVPSAPASEVAGHARRLQAEGRLSVSHQELVALSGGSRPTTSEETLFGFSVRELSAAEPSVRIRAAERLKTLKDPAAGPALANALNTEEDGAVLVALLQAFAANAPFAEESAALVAPLLSSHLPEVRLTALKALLTLSPTEALPHLSAAMKDPDRAVRRRATLLALSLPKEDALAVGEAALADADADVRAVGIRVLSAGGGERARELVQRALRDADPKVRKAAAQGISCVVGEDLSEVVSLSEGALRREIRRISHLPARPQAPRTVAPPPRVSPPTPMPAPALAPAPAYAPVAVAVGVGGTRSAPVARTMSLELPAAMRIENRPSEDLVNALMAEIRCSLRGKLLRELAQSVQVTEEAAADACDLLVARGQAVMRGRKFFAA